jgi:hypothetical protein
MNIHAAWYMQRAHAASSTGFRSWRWCEAVAASWHDELRRADLSTLPCETVFLYLASARRELPHMPRTVTPKSPSLADATGTVSERAANRHGLGGSYRPRRRLRAAGCVRIWPSVAAEVDGEDLDDAVRVAASSLGGCWVELVVGSSRAGDLVMDGLGVAGPLGRGVLALHHA